MNRPEVIKDNIRHRHGCPTPEPALLPSQISGWQLRRCPTCGTSGLERITALPGKETK